MRERETTTFHLVKSLDLCWLMVHWMYDVCLHCLCYQISPIRDNALWGYPCREKILNLKYLIYCDQGHSKIARATTLLCT